MTTKEIIAQLKVIGLNPENVTIEQLNDSRVEDLVAALGVAMNDGDAEATTYYEALMVSVDKFDSPGAR